MRISSGMPTNAIFPAVHFPHINIKFNIVYHTLFSVLKSRPDYKFLDPGHYFL